MQLTFQLIQIVKAPNDKNCWLAVNDYPQLRKQFATFIEDYDFIDFEGKVFYYNQLFKLPISDRKAFHKRYENNDFISYNEGLEAFLSVLSPETKQIVLSNFVEDDTVILLKQ